MSGTILKAQSAWQTCALFLLMVLGSALLFRYVERPFRKVVPKPGWSFPVAVITVLALGPIGVMVEKATIPASEMVIHEAFTDRADFRCPRSHRVLHPTATSCELTGLPNPRRRILLVGDSHAESIKTAFAEAAKQANVAVHFLVANNPLMPGGLTARELVEEATTLHADAIVMHYLTHGVDFNAVREMAASARAQHISAAFIMPVPVWDRSVPIALLDRTLPRQDIADYRRQNADLIEAITSVDFPVYQTAETLCTPECQSLVDGHPAYFDNSHLTLSGARLLRGLFDQVIADLPAHEGEFTQDGEPKKTI